MTERKSPCLCISCPDCGSIVIGTAMKKEYHMEQELNQQFVHELCDLSAKGYNVSFKDSSEFSMNTCQCADKKHG